MTKFKIVFMDGKEVEQDGLNFQCACVLAAYARLQDGSKTHQELEVNEYRCEVLKQLD
jgi:hypothetical protein